MQVCDGACTITGAQFEHPDVVICGGAAYGGSEEFAGFAVFTFRTEYECSLTLEKGLALCTQQ